ncbi:protein kinase [Cryptosporidium ryanae]|uniref:protein kinase n=1 Tax=Cryptosporidium ryanae TaxID=515981 RepID=UPI00351A20E8|nr:protein kinase [Cryptosporidium ryanae]
MWEEANRTIWNIIKASKSNNDGMTTKILNFVNLHIEKNIKKVTKNLTNEYKFDFDDIFDLINSLVEKINEREKKITYSNSYYLNDFEGGLIKNCFIDFENENELNSWLKELIKEEIFTKIDLGIPGEIIDIEFKSLILEYQNFEILSFNLPIEFYKLFFEKFNLFSSKQVVFIEDTKFSLDKAEINYSDSFNCAFYNNLNCFIFKYLDENYSTSSLCQINASFQGNTTFSQKVESEKLKIKIDKKLETNSCYRYNNVINISFSTGNAISKYNVKTTLYDLYNEYFKLTDLDNEDEINMCMSPYKTKKEIEIGTEFREFLKINFDSLILANRFLLIKLLYHGNFGDIYVGVDILTYKLHCIKKIKGNIQEKAYFVNSLNEASVAKELSNSTISRFVPIYEDTIVENGSFYIVNELLGENLLFFNKLIHRKKNKGLIFGIIQRIIRQLLLCLKDLHEKYEIIHCDIKPENIVIDSIDSFDILGYFDNCADQYSEVDIKLVDWGSCIKIRHSLSMKNSYLQSRYYRSPEICLGLPFDEKIDIWSVGCILVELITGKPLFIDVKTTQQLLASMISVLGKIPISMIAKSTTIKHFITFDGHIYERTNTNKLRVYTKFSKKCFHTQNLKEMLNFVDESLLDLIEKLLSIDPKERPSASRALEHPWFQYKYIDFL